jgi:hypothetical protein
LYSSARFRGRGKQGRFTGFRNANARRLLSIQLARFANAQPVALSAALHYATDREEKDMRLKKKTVVPVVRLGKVETRPKRLCRMSLIACYLF